MSAATIAASLRFSRRTGDLPRGGHYSATEGKYWTLWVLPECRLLATSGCTHALPMTPALSQ